MEARPAKLSKNQQGFAAIVIALVLILVLSLVTIGFAQLMRREQRSALDRQLSSQAYYAAESGVNDAVKAINAGYFQTTPGNPPASKMSCGPITTGTGAAYFSSNAVGNNTGATYPCLIVNPMPPNLQYGSIDTTNPKVIEMEGIDPATSNPAAIHMVEISWQDTGTNNNFATNCNNFYPASGTAPTWSNASGPLISPLRAQLIPINDLSRNGLINNSYTAFLCPDTGGSNISDYASNKGNNSGVIVDGRCTNGTPTPTAPRACNAKISGLGSISPGQATFFLVLRSLYSSTTVTVTAYSSDDTSHPLNIANAQILVDSTGKAQDVLRRIQVRVPVHNNYDIPNGNQAMQNLCKQLQLTPGGGTSNPSPDCNIP